MTSLAMSLGKMTSTNRLPTPLFAAVGRRPGRQVTGRSCVHNARCRNGQVETEDPRWGRTGGSSDIQSLQSHRQSSSGRQIPSCRRARTSSKECMWSIGILDMRQACQFCEHFKYADSNVYGRCQCYESGSVLGGAPRIPWAAACEFFRAAEGLDKSKSNIRSKSDEGVPARPRETSSGAGSCCDSESK